MFAFCVVIGTPVAFALGIAALSAFWYEGLPLFVGFQRIVWRSLWCFHSH